MTSDRTGEKAYSDARGEKEEKTPSFLYQLWLKSEKKRQEKREKKAKSKEETTTENLSAQEQEKESSLEDLEEVHRHFVQETSVIHDKKETAWLDEGMAVQDSIKELWMQWGKSGGKAYSPFEYFADSPEGQEGNEEQKAFLGELQEKARILLERDRLPSEEYDVNASVATWISPDKMTAWIFLFPPLDGGTGIQEEVLRQQLAHAGIRSGIQEDFVQAILKEELYCKLLPIAKGTPPVDGTDGYLENCLSQEIQTKIEQLEEKETLYRSLNQIAKVEVGLPLYKIIPPTEMVPGEDVRGRAVRGKRGQPAKMPRIANTAISADGTTLVSTIDGYLCYQNEQFVLNNVLIIDGDVGYGDGDLEYDGDILIYGNVEEGVSIHSKGTVEVRGMVGSASITAHKDIVIGKGMNGNSVGQLKTKANVKSKFLENCTVEAGGSVYTDSVLWSNISCGEDLIANTGRGVIIGGDIRVIRNIQAKAVGNASRRQTTLIVGSTPEILAQREALDKEIAEIQKQLREVLKDIQFLENLESITPQQKKVLAQRRLNKPVLQMKERQRLEELEDICDKIHAAKEGKIRCDVLYPGTHISMGSASMPIDSVSYRCNIYYEKGDIVFKTI